MILGYDHAIFLVASPDGLGEAARRFEALGFSITERDDADRQTSATAQKLVCLADGSYIEILAIRDAEARRRHRFAHLLGNGDGWADSSVHTDDLAAVEARLRAAGLPFGGPHRHERRLSSGEPWGVRLVLPGIGAGHGALPFVIEDIAGRSLRIPFSLTRHDNAAVGTAGMTVSVHDLGSAARGFDALFGRADAQPDPLHPSDRSLRYRVGAQWLDVIERPNAPEGLVSVALARQGQEAVSWLVTGRHAIALVPA